MSLSRVLQYILPPSLLGDLTLQSDGRLFPIKLPTIVSFRVYNDETDILSLAEGRLKCKSKGSSTVFLPSRSPFVKGQVTMALLRTLLYLLSTALLIHGEESYESQTTFGANGFANWGAGNWPPSTVGVPLVPQSTDPQTLSLLNEMDPDRIQSTIQTLVNFYTRHTASTTTSATRGIGAARQWLLNEMMELAKPSNGLMTVSMPCYEQPAAPANGIPFAVQVCNVQAEIKGAVDPNRTYVYTGHYDSRRINNSDYINYAPGADDNASAVAIALELVRILAPVLSKSPPAASIIIAAVSGEEQGLYGSNFLAQTCKVSRLLFASLI